MFLGSLYLVGVESCGLIKSMSFRHFWSGFRNGSRSNGDNSYSEEISASDDFETFDPSCSANTATLSVTG
jgi:hypothetical protein